MGVFFFGGLDEERGATCEGNTVVGARQIGIGAFDLPIDSVSRNQVSQIGPTPDVDGFTLSHGIVLNEVTGLQTFRGNQFGAGVLSVGFLLQRSASPIALIVMNGRVGPDDSPGPDGCLVAQGEGLVLDEARLAADNPDCDIDVRSDPADFLPVPMGLR